MIGKLVSLANEGYNDRKNTRLKMKEHEESDEHGSALVTLLARMNTGDRIDKSLVLQTRKK